MNKLLLTQSASGRDVEIRYNDDPEIVSTIPIHIYRLLVNSPQDRIAELEAQLAHKDKVIEEASEIIEELVCAIVNEQSISYCRALDKAETWAENKAKEAE